MGLPWHEVHGEGNGPWVVLSSGLGGSANFWAPQMPALLAAGFRVLRYDQRGTGRSAQTLATPYSITDMAGDVLSLLDACDIDRAALIGHALGGLVGLQLAVSEPRRISALALINAWAQPNAHSQRCFSARLRLLDSGGARAYVEAQPIFLYPAAWALEHAALVQAEVEHALAHFPGEANLRARIAALLEFNIAPALSNISQPVWLSAAQDDVLVPWTCSRDMARVLPSATLDCVPHGGHAHCVTDAPAFNTGLVQFLSSSLKQSSS
jgi:aminoacrylate hydrolase